MAAILHIKNVLVPSWPVGRNEASGGPVTQYKMIKLTAVPGAASDTITLLAAVDGITVIDAIISSELLVTIAACKTCSATASGLVITLKTYKSDGTAADDWTGVSASIIILGH